jgi:hypothetical protein
MDRKRTFWTETVYLLVLLILGVLFALGGLSFVPESFGPVPVGVPWFGAVGAVLISLTGVFEHEQDWDPNHWPWHVARPLIGASLGVVSMLILKAGVLAVGSTPNPGQSIPPNLLYYVIAFVVGYREETFRELIKRVADIILTPGDGGVAVPTITNVNPAQVIFNAPQAVVITGSGFTNTQSVRFGASVAQFTFNADNQLTVTTPNMPAPIVVPLTVTTKGGSATYSFTFI